MPTTDSIYISIVLTLFVVTVGAFAVLAPHANTGPNAKARTLQTSPTYHYSVFGEQQIVDPNTFYQLCVGTDCIPSLRPHQTHYEPAPDADNWLRPSDTVASVSVNGEDVAFPFPILQHHFVVNTVIDGEPILVTYSPYAGFPAAFSRIISDGSVSGPSSFKFTGLLLYGDIVMKDNSGTYWSPFLGEAINGPSASTRLHRLTVQVTRWSLWERNHPNGTVLSRRTGIYNRSIYRDDPYFAYRSSTSVPGDPYDGTVQPKEIVYGLSTGKSMGYREVNIKDLGLIQDQVGHTPVLIVQDERTGNIHAYDRQVAGNTLTFHRTNGGLVSSDGTYWNDTGNAVSGPLQGKKMDQLRLSRIYWFAWKRFHPSTQIYQPAE